MTALETFGDNFEEVLEEMEEEAMNVTAYFFKGVLYGACVCVRVCVRVCA